ncbi:MAG: HAD hydrolase-like protein [Bacteroidetes bacterium]|nr:HAD hydrolase-like protein [Bacteroidota bacterium]
MIVLTLLLFDFDQVLVDTEPYRYLRESRKWGQYRHLMSELEPCGGIDRLIHSASSRGHSIAIVTQSPGFVPKLFAQKWSWPIDNIVGWHDYKIRKPDPLCLKVAMKRVNAQPSESFHIGDLPSDTEASKRAGVKSIGAGWACADRNALLKSQPDYYFDTVEDLYQFIVDLNLGLK